MANCLTPSAVAKHCGFNASGIKPKMYVALPSEIDTLPAPTNGVVATDITMIPTNVFKEINISKVDGQFTAEPEGDIDGLELPIVLNGFIPYMDGARSAALTGMQGGEYIFIVIDRNGKKWILGDKEEGAFFKVGVQTGDKNGYPVTIEWTTSYMPYEYTGVIPE